MNLRVTTGGDQAPTDGANYRVAWIPQLPGPTFFVAADTLQAAVELTDVLARYDLFQYENQIKPDYSNMAVIEVWDGTEWSDADDDEISEIEDALGLLPS
jgi:hypothetical protein